MGEEKIHIKTMRKQGSYQQICNTSQILASNLTLMSVLLYWLKTEMKFIKCIFLPCIKWAVAKVPNLV